MKINDNEEENEDLRYRLGMDPKEPLDLTEFRKNKKLRKEEEKALNFILQKEVWILLYSVLRNAKEVMYTLILME